MRYGRPIIQVQLLLACSLLLAVRSDGAASHGISIRSNAGGPVERCDQLDITFDDRPALRDHETLQIRPEIGPFKVRVTHHGGIGLREAPGHQHEITLCKAVPDDAGGDLTAIRAVINGSSVEVSGPTDGRWVGYLLVTSPRGSHVALSTANAPVRVDSFEGQLEVQTVNGPIDLALVRGNVTARAENGPIKVVSDGGYVSLNAQNGPIGVRLVGGRWQAGQLEARAVNGPLSIAVPSQYQSGVEIESAGHAPWSCGGQRDCGTDDNESATRRLRLGDGRRTSNCRL